MNNQIQLKNASYYSEERIKGENISINEFVTTDSMLQNKLGITKPQSVPNGNLISFKYGDILVGNIRPYLKKIWFANKSGGCSPDVLVLRANSGFDSKFLYYSLFRDDFFNHMMKGAKGTKMPRGDKSQTLRFEIPDIDINDQQKIASVLSSLDSKIELNNRINAELEAMAKTIYDYWFMQFDFPDKNGKPYKSSGGKMVWNEELKREIPEGWEVKELGDLVRQVSDNIEPDEFPLLPYLPIDKLPSKRLYYSDYDSRDHANSSLLRFAENDILLGAMRVYFHRVCNAIEDGISRSTLLVLRPSNPINKNFALFTLNKDESIEFATKNSTGTSIPYAKWNGSLEKMTICIPSRDIILVAFNKLVDPILEKFKLLSKQNQQLAELRDWLLPMLMNGQVTVKFN
jgi:type I restriction enzyme S subunit